MEKKLVRATAFAVFALCLLGGCATEPKTTDGTDPYHVESPAPYAHGETSVQYGHSAGH